MVHADTQEERENAGQRRLKDNIGILEDADSIDNKISRSGDGMLSASFEIIGQVRLQRYSHNLEADDIWHLHKQLNLLYDKA